MAAIQDVKIIYNINIAYKYYIDRTGSTLVQNDINVWTAQCIYDFGNRSSSKGLYLFTFQ